MSVPASRARGNGPGWIAIIGAPSPLGARDDRLAAAIDGLVETVTIRASHPWRQQARVLRDTARAVTQARCEAIHVFEPGFLPAALLLRARFGVPISVTLTARDLDGRAPWRRGIAGLVRRVDQAFTSDPQAIPSARERGFRPPLTHVPAVAAVPWEPTAGALGGVGRRLTAVAPERLVVGMPWPADREQARWYRDAVAPLLHGSPVCLLLGSPGGRRVRLIAGPQNLRGGMRPEGMRAHNGALTADVISAAARYVDVFALPADPSGSAPLRDVLLALAASGVPTVIGGGVTEETLEHEREYLLVDPHDPMGMVSVLNQVLALPSQQRHQLGYEFAAQVLRRWSPEAAAAVYADRFAVLLGRPQIPAELRAAA